MARAHRRRLAGTALPEHPHGPAASIQATARALERVGGASTIVLVEGVSDQIAVETLAVRIGRQLDSDGVVIVPINGAQAVGKFVRRFRAAPERPRLLGLCDVAERRWFDQVTSDLGSQCWSCFVCERDLEDELLRATGRPAIEMLLDAHGELGSFRTLQRQPNWRGRSFDEQFHRWLRAGARRNLRYARLLVEACDEPPAPLAGLLGATRQ